jgi:UDP-N-acetylglucosamine 2-epimerase (non-hydrolysing)
MVKRRVLIVAGTRPEAIKLAPLHLYLQSLDFVQSFFCVTGQHRNMLDQVLSFFKITPCHDLDVMIPNQCPADVAARVLSKLTPVFEKVRPDVVVVQGDTTSALAAALAAYYYGIPVAHVEAGLRTYDLNAPFPEEGNRQCISRIATLHFAPTNLAKRNLIDEHISENHIYTTGNTVIDSLFLAQNILAEENHDKIYPARAAKAKNVLITMHRRENREHFSQIFSALLDVAEKYPNLNFLFPVHSSPLVQSQARAAFESHPSFSLVEPLSYPQFVQAMLESHVLFTDSGGVQEEAPALGKHVFLARDVTERPEAVDAGYVQLVGQDRQRILNAFDMISSQPLSRPPCLIYGDGHASERIARAFAELWQSDVESFKTPFPEIV